MGEKDQARPRKGVLICVWLFSPPGVFLKFWGGAHPPNRGNVYWFGKAKVSGVFLTGVVGFFFVFSFFCLLLWVFFFFWEMGIDGGQAGNKQ